MQYDHHLARMLPPKPRPVQVPASNSDARKRQTAREAQS